MKKRSELKLSTLFTIAVFLIQSISSLLPPVFVIVGFQLGLAIDPNPVYLLICVAFTSIFFGILFSKIVGTHILKSITDLSAASSMVAKGNFQVQLNEKCYGKELTDMIRNFNIMTNELKHIETLRDDFVANVSHEFKTPISVINGYAMLLQDETISSEKRDNYIECILSNSKRLSRLTENILLISKLENQEIVLDKAFYSLDEQLRNELLSLENLWSLKNLSLDIDLENIQFYGNKYMLSLVWHNLLSNAIKFTPDGGKLTITLKKEGTFASVVISDTGIGMSEETMKHIFEKFYCADKSRHNGGNGLGLTLVNRIVYLCGGSIDVQSALNRGTDFRVKLPNESH